jgi:hypothetical protein
MKIYQAVKKFLVGAGSLFGMIEVTFNAITTIQNIIQIHQSVQNLHPPLKYKRLPFWSDRCHLQRYHLHTKFEPNLPISSNVIRGFFSPTSEL